MTESVSCANSSSARNLWSLFAAQSLAGAAAPIIFTLAGLVGQTLTPKPALATLPVSLYTLGLAFSTLPAALLMRRFGRRPAYLLASLICIAAGALACVAILQKSFVLFCLSTFMAGFHGACVQSFRFAAADMAPAGEQARAISRIMIGGLVAAVIGPQVVIWTRDAWPSALYVGSFIGMAGVVVLSMPFLFLLQPAPTQTTTVDGEARPLWLIARQPVFFIAALSGLLSFGLMSFIMTAAPLAMVGHGHSVGDAALGIQWHVLAMFAPSFITGDLIQRFGKIAVTASGLLLIGGAGVVALMGSALLPHWAALVLLGIGWNFGFIGATAMVTDSCLPPERAKVQALNDFMVFGTVAVASFSSGQLLHLSGWETLNILMFPLIAFALLMLLFLALKQRRALSAT